MRPHVICHMCTTIDGKILVDRWGTSPTTRSGSSLFESTAASFGIDAWIVGNTTMQEFAGKPQPLKPAPKSFKRADHVATATAKSFAIGVDRKGTLRFQSGEVDGDHTVLLVTKKVSNAYLAHLQSANVSYLICGTNDVDLKLALTKLHKTFGIKKLMLEGGGRFNGSMLHAGLVDEISQVIVPIVDGGVGVSSIFDIPGDAPKHAAARLLLTSHRSLPGGVVWNRYKVLGPTTGTTTGHKS